MNLNSILIGSENPRQLADYYTKLFGKPGWDDGGYVGWLIGSGGLTVGPHSEVHGTNPEPGRLIFNIETPDVKGDFATFKAAGATVVARAVQLRGRPTRGSRRSAIRTATTSSWSARWGRRRRPRRASPIVARRQGNPEARDVAPLPPRGGPLHHAADQCVDAAPEHPRRPDG